APNSPQEADAYPGTCAGLSTSEAQRRVRSGESHCIRARAGGATIAYSDRILGRIEGVIDHFVVVRRDGVPAYNLASIVDDSDFAFQEIVRGADLAPTTLRQLWIARTIGMYEPQWAHIPIVRGIDGT